MPRDGVQVEPEIAFDRLQKYVGGYRDPAGALVFEILIQHQRLAVRLPNGTSLDLLLPTPMGAARVGPTSGSRSPLRKQRVARSPR